MTYQPRDQSNTTLAIALRFGVTHEELLEAVEYLRLHHFAHVKTPFAAHFAEFQHADPHGNLRRAYRMDRCGLLLLAGAYLGDNAEARGVPENKKAAEAAEEFIADFNKLEAECVRRGIAVAQLDFFSKPPEGEA